MKILAAGVIILLAVMCRYKVYVIQVHNGEDTYIVKYDRWLDHTYKCEDGEDDDCRRID